MKFLVNPKASVKVAGCGIQTGKIACGIQSGKASICGRQTGKATCGIQSGRI